MIKIEINIMKTQKDIDTNQEYKYGFTTDIENIRAPKGLNEDTIKFISNIKKEPKWMLEWRLKAFNRLKKLKEPNWQKPKYPKIIIKIFIIILLQKCIRKTKKFRRSRSKTY